MANELADGIVESLDFTAQLGEIINSVPEYLEIAALQNVVQVNYTPKGFTITLSKKIPLKNLIHNILNSPDSR